MAITTQAGALSGLQMPVAFVKVNSNTPVAGAPQSLYPVGGNPAAGAYPNTGLTGGVYSSTSAVPAGCLYHTDPPSGNAYLASLKASSTAPLTLLLVDRLWDCEPAINSTSLQTITPPSLPARDALGQTNGLGVQMAIEVVAAVSSTAAVLSMSYTNSAGTAGQTGAFAYLPTAATTAIGRFFPIGLQAGDLGVQSVQSVTFSAAWTSGTIALVAYRIIAALDLPVTGGMPNMIDVISSGFPQIYNGSSLFFVYIPSTATTPIVTGTYTETQG